MFKKIAHAVKPDSKPTSSNVDTKLEGDEIPPVEQVPIQDQASHTGAPKAVENEAILSGGPSNQSSQPLESGTTIGPSSNVPSAEAPPTESGQVVGASRATNPSSDPISDEGKNVEGVPSERTQNVPTGSEDINGTRVTKAADTTQQTNGTGEKHREESEAPSSQITAEQVKVEAGINDAEGRLKFA